MPGKTKGGRRMFRRRNTKPKVKRNYKRRGLQNLSLQVMPKIKYATHRYAESTQLFINNAFDAQLIYTLNGLFDPNVAGGAGAGINHQPYLFDQMNALYNKYCVLGAKVKIHLRPGSTSNSYAMNVFGETTQLTSVQYPGSIGLEKPGVRVARFNSSASNVYTPAKTMTFYWSAKKEFRAKDRQELITSEDYSGTGSTLPSQQAYLYITYQAQQIQQTTAKLACDVIIDYIVAWTEPKQPNQS